MKPEEQLSAGFDKWAEESGLEFSNGVNSFVNWTPNTRAIAFKAYRAAYAQARREALEEAGSLCDQIAAAYISMSDQSSPLAECGYRIRALIKD